MARRDVSKEAVVVLLLLTVIVALVGTVSVTQTASNLNFEPQADNSQPVKASGLVVNQPYTPPAGRASINILTSGDETQ